VRPRSRMYEAVLKLVEANPAMSKAGLGRLAHEKYPGLFKTPEAARSVVRSVTGAKGKRDRDRVKTRTDLWTGDLSSPILNPYPRVQVDPGRIGIISDIHIPFYDPVALSAAVTYLADLNLDTLILNGDIIDCYQISRFGFIPMERTRLRWEVDALQKFIVKLKLTFPKTRIIYKTGNHEDRWDRYILNRVPELFGTKITEFGQLVKADGVELVEDKRVIEAGNLHIIHGHEYPGMSSPVNPARAFFLRAKTNVIGGHLHRTSEHIERDLSDKMIGSWSTGCLCDLTPEYRPLNPWNHGFAWVELDNSGDFEVHNKKILDGLVR